MALVRHRITGVVAEVEDSAVKSLEAEWAKIEVATTRKPRTAAPKAE